MGLSLLSRQITTNLLSHSVYESAIWVHYGLAGSSVFRSHKTKIKALGGLCSFLEALEKNLFLSTLRLLATLISAPLWD